MSGKRRRYWVWALGANPELRLAIDAYHAKWGRYPKEIYLYGHSPDRDWDFEGIAIKYSLHVTSFHAQLWPVPNKKGEWEDDTGLATELP